MAKGKKIILAVFMAALFLVGIMPLSISAKYIAVAEYGSATFTPSTRYSLSGGGWTSASGYGAYTIPIPIDLKSDLIIVNVGFRSNTSVYVLNTDFSFFKEPASEKSDEYYRIPFKSIDGCQGKFLILTAPNDGVAGGINVNDIFIGVISGSYNNAVPSRYVAIEVPDSAEDIPNNVLSFWQEVLTAVANFSTGLFDALLYPISLLIGVPIVIALFWMLFRLLLFK